MLKTSAARRNALSDVQASARRRSVSYPFLGLALSSLASPIPNVPPPCFELVVLYSCQDLSQSVPSSLLLSPSPGGVWDARTSRPPRRENEMGLLYEIKECPRISSPLVFSLTASHRIRTPSVSARRSNPPQPPLPWPPWPSCDVPVLRPSFDAVSQPDASSVHP